jgi:hypothetical protein
MHNQGIFLFYNHFFEIFCLTAIPSTVRFRVLKISLAFWSRMAASTNHPSSIEIYFARPKLGNQLNDPLLLKSALFNSIFDSLRAFRLL